MNDPTNLPHVIDPEEFEHQLLDTLWRVEPLHEKDCPACDIAADIAGTLAATWDPLELWVDTAVIDGCPGDSYLDQATRCAAHVLHRRLPGHSGRPSIAALKRQQAELRAERAQTGGAL